MFKGSKMVDWRCICVLFLPHFSSTSPSFSLNRYCVPAVCQALIQVNETKTDPFPQRAIGSNYKIHNMVHIDSFVEKNKNQEGRWEVWTESGPYLTESESGERRDS